MKTPRVPIDMSRGPSARKKKSGSCVMIPHLPRSLRDVEWCCRLVQPFLGAFYSETVALILFQLRRRAAFVDGNGAPQSPLLVLCRVDDARLAKNVHRRFASSGKRSCMSTLTIGIITSEVRARKQAQSSSF